MVSPTIPPIFREALSRNLPVELSVLYQYHIVELADKSLTVTPRQNPSSTIRIFSSGVYLLQVAVLTLHTKDLASSVRSSAPSALGVSVWDIFAPLSEVLYLIQGADPTSNLSALPTSFCVPLSLTIYTLPTFTRYYTAK